MRLTHAALAAALLLAVLLSFARQASAYPQFQFSTFNPRCNLCHFSPVGGGLINGFGRDESADTISHTAGKGGFLHGIWSPPDWVQIGGDLRGAVVIRQNDDEPEVLAFPMQADLYTRFAIGSRVSVNLTTGVRGAAREPRDSTLARIVSREHYVMWQQQGDTGWHTRIGRFFAPYGLRLQDHTAYVRRYMGFHTLEETYTASAGNISDEREVHAAVFVTAPNRVPQLLFGVGEQAAGGTVYYERRIREGTSAVAAQSKVAFASAYAQLWVGGIAKLWLESKKLLVLGELNLGVQSFSDMDNADPRLQLAGYAGATYFVRQGLMLGVTLERYDPDMLLSGTARDAASISLQYFPRSHWEIMWVGKLELQGGSSPDPMSMLMLHYYL